MTYSSTYSSNMEPDARFRMIKLLLVTRFFALRKAKALVWQYGAVVLMATAIVVTVITFRQQPPGLTKTLLDVGATIFGAVTILGLVSTVMWHSNLRVVLTELLEIAHLEYSKIRFGVSEDYNLSQLYVRVVALLAISAEDMALLQETSTKVVLEAEEEFTPCIACGNDLEIQPAPWDRQYEVCYCTACQEYVLLGSEAADFVGQAVARPEEEAWLPEGPTVVPEGPGEDSSAGAAPDEDSLYLQDRAGPPAILAEPEPAQDPTPAYQWPVGP